MICVQIERGYVLGYHSYRTSLQFALIPSTVVTNIFSSYSNSRRLFFHASIIDLSLSTSRWRIVVGGGGAIIRARKHKALFGKRYVDVYIHYPFSRVYATTGTHPQFQVFTRFKFVRGIRVFQLHPSHLFSAKTAYRVRNCLDGEFFKYNST